VAEVWLSHTSELDAATLAAARDLLDQVFGDEMTDHDWEHSLGGMHALAWDGGELVGHGSVIQRRLMHGGRALRTGYVEGVAVRRDRHGQGYGAAVMGPLEHVIRGGYELGALGSTAQAIGFYTARGWQPWQGPTSALTPDGIRPTPDDDHGIFVLPVSARLDLAAELTCDWREGDLW
jgi:aminoglycoside 2'-N-acetyltransferase I